MKTSLLSLVLVFPVLVMQGQSSKKTGVSGNSTMPLKDVNDSLSYAIGVTVAHYCQDQGIQSVKSELVTKGLNDALKNSNRQLTDQQANSLVVSYVQKVRQERLEANKKQGEAFLEKNKTKPGVVATPSGLQYEVIKQGDGPKPGASDKVKCNYEGRLLDGTVFDASAQHGGPITLTVNQVIAGWTEALQMMPVGSKWRLYVPSSLGYGDQPMGGSPIKPGSTLIFDVELVDIVK